MAMSLADFSRLKKFMALTASDNDAEALASMQQANRVLAQNGYTWDMVFGRTVKVLHPIEADPVDEEADEKEALFDRALRGASGEFRTMLLSIQSQYQTKGWLSEKQWAVVKNACDRE